MTLRLRLIALFAFATLLPVVPAAWVTRDLLHRSLEIGQSKEIDAGLEGGVHLAQRELRLRTAELRSVARRFVDQHPSPASAIDWPDTLTRVEWMRGGETRILVPGPQALGLPDPPRATGDPPFRIRVQVAGERGAVWVFERPLDPQWRDDAMAAADALQLVRGFGAQSSTIEGAFLRPFLAIYFLALVLSCLGAAWMARGITRPVERLLHATEAVASGSWDQQVEESGPRELRQLSAGFNRMVNTLDAQNRQLVEMETLAGWREMARALAHEVKNPLTPIQLTVEEMRQRYRGEDQSYRELLDECTRIVVEEVESLREVVTRFREFSRPVELQPEPVDLNALATDLAALQKDFVVELDLSPSVPRIVADPQRIRQMLMNLASNVRDLASSTEELRWRISTRVEEESLLLRVEDNGSGIPPEERQRVFDPYRSGRSGGLGLGLALVKGIVLAHGGSIEVDEGEWGGARFSIRLPIEGEIT